MPKTITQVNTADNYTEQGGANINSAYQSKGGWVSLPAQVLAQIQHSSAPDNSQGQEQWSDEFVLPSGAHYLQPGIIGIRFRSFTAGVPVAVSAAIFYRDEYAIQLGGSGLSTPSTPNVPNLNFQHNDLAVATEPTADFEDGTNFFTWTMVDDPANTRVKITPVLSNQVNFPGNAQIVGQLVFAESSATNIIISSAVTGDTVNRFQIQAQGNIAWGPGNAAGDTFLQRNSTNGLLGTPAISTGPVLGGFTGTQTAGNIMTTTTFRIFEGAAGTGALTIGVTTDTAARFQILASGENDWGPGNAAVDCNFLRLTAGVLGSTNASLSTGPTSAGSSATNGVFIQSTASTGGGIWSVGANSAFTSWATLVNGDTTARFTIFQSGTLFWGPGNAAADTTLQRLAVGVLGSVGVTALSSGPTSNTFSGAQTTGYFLNAASQITFFNTVAFDWIQSGRTTDTNRRFSINDSGLMQWGPGNAAQDTTFQRTNVSRLQFGTTSQTCRVDVQSQATTDVVFSTFIQGDTQPRWQVRGDGTNLWGPGNAAADVTVSRAITNPTPAHLVVNKSIAASGSVYAGLTTVSPTPTTSTTPDFSQWTSYIITIGGTGGGTLTINADANPPASTQTGFMYIQISNAPGNTATALTWAGQYLGTAIALPTTISGSGFWRLLFVWTGASWLLIIKINL